MLIKGVVVFTDTRRPDACTCGNPAIPALECVANRPIAHHVLDALLSAGVDDLVIAGPADVLIEVRACLSEYQVAPLTLHYVVSSDGSNPVAGLHAAATLVGTAPCILHLGDGLLDEPLRPHLDELEEGSADLILLCGSPHVSGPLRPLVDGDSSALTPAPDGPGVGIFGPGLVAEACRMSCRELPPGLASLARRVSDDGRHVRTHAADGWRRYQGQPSELLEIHRLALDLLPPTLRLASSNQNRIEGRVHIDRTASVTTSVIVGPVVIGEGAHVSNAYIGPYTSIGADARIDGAEIERSIIAPGATVMNVGPRLVSSLVGRHARVFHDFSLPRAVRLRVGEADEVALC